VTSEIVLLKILLLEKFPDLSGEGRLRNLSLLPVPSRLSCRKRMQRSLSTSIQLSPDAADVCLDLVTSGRPDRAPVRSRFWVGHEDAIDASWIASLADAAPLASLSFTGLRARSGRVGRFPKDVLAYLSAFAYVFDNETQDAVSEFFRYAYYHGVLGDIPI